MKQLEDGTWLLADGRILTSEQLANQKAPLAEGAKTTKDEKLDLEEGQSSGVIQLCD